MPKHWVRIVGLVLLPMGFWLSSALGGPHCCPIIVQDVNLIKPEQLVPDATFHVPVEILGKSTHRTRGHPSVVMMSVHLPSNYDRKKAHPVVVHLGGGVDQRKFIGRWTSITGNKDWIVLLAEYTSRLDSGPRNAGQMLRILEAATPIKHGMIVLGGISSGSWGMNTNFGDQFYTRGYMDMWDGFVFIAGNNNGFVSVTKDKLDGRPALFVGGNHGGAHAIQKKTYEEIKAAGGNSSFIDMQAPYDDFPGWCDPLIMGWIKTNLVANVAKHEAFDKEVAAIDKAQVSSSVKAERYLKMLQNPLHHYFGKVTSITHYLDIAKAEKDEAKRKEMLDKLLTIPNLPRTWGPPYQDALVWLKDQPGYDGLAKQLGRHNPFIEPVVDPPNGYGPNVDYRAR